ncbi:hypothetical protein GCM10025787_21230 [Saccharopolyspora rosea]
MDLAAFLAELPIAAAVFDAAEHVRWSNEPFRRLHPDIPEPLSDALRAAHETVRHTGRTLVRDSAGEPTWRTYHFPMPEPGHVGSVLLDITGLVDAQRRVRQWRSRTLDMMLSLPLPIAACRLHGQIVEANPPMAEFLGQDMRSLRGVTLTELLRPTDPAVLDKIGRTLRAGGRAAYRFSAVPLSERASGSAGSVTLQPVPHPELDASGLLVVVVPEPPAAEPGPAPPAELAERERRVLEEVALGRPSTAIARSLGMTADGVNYHLARLRDRLGATNRTALVAAAYARGLLRGWPPSAG